MVLEMREGRGVMRERDEVGFFMRMNLMMDGVRGNGRGDGGRCALMVRR